MEWLHAKPGFIELDDFYVSSTQYETVKVHFIIVRTVVKRRYPKGNKRLGSLN